MAKANLDSIVRSLVGVDRDYLGTVADIANRLNSADASRWHDRFTGVLKEGLLDIELPAPLPPLLAFDDARFASVDLGKLHNPDVFWKTTKSTPARYVWDSFRTNVVARAVPSSPSGIVKVPYSDLPRNTTVREILKAPGVGDHDPSRFCHIIASMIEKQPNGEPDPDGLLNDGRGNFFPCGSVLVNVYWRDGDRKWHVFDWSPVHGVYAGRRVFSGNLLKL